MSSQREACQAVEAVLRAAESSRGGSVGYTPYHVYTALKLLSERDPLGRPRLQRLLGLGEAPVKTLLQRLEALGLAAKAGKGRGHTTTERGRRLYRRVEEVVRLYRVRATPLGEAIVIVTPLLEPVRDLVGVYRVRDYLVAENCRLCIIGGVDNGIPQYPGLPEEEAGELRGLDPGVTRGVIVVVPRECVEKAFTGVLRLVSAEYCR